jgi:hypothetical protein
MNYDYSYDVNYLFKTVGENAYYQYDFCRVFLCKDYDDMILKVQDSLLEKFKTNKKLQNILDIGVNNGFGMPIEMNHKMVFSFLFNYDFFYYIHRCLQDLFKTEDISDENFNKLINLLKK